MKIHFLYYTSTGNTLWLATKAKEYFEDKGHEVQLYEILKDSEAFDKDECDLKGIFYPVWGSDPPDPMMEYRKKMLEGNGQKIFLVGNCCAFSGDTGMRWKRVLEKKGYDVIFGGHVIMPTDFNMPWMPWNVWKRVPEGEKLQKILDKALTKLHGFCESILNEEHNIDGKGPINWVEGASQRGIVWTEAWWKNHYSVSEELCIKCGLCTRICPTGNITKTEEGKIIFGDNCIMCVKCYNHCPKNAVLIFKKSINTKKYPRYKGPSKEIRPVQYRK